jgi:outer membrane protein assembly factor BamE (lipoprotein component of BamABCDE complex)
LYVGQSIIEETFQEEYTLFRSIKVGMTELEVVRILGQPYKTYDAMSAPEDYYVQGYSYKRRPITNKVYIYVRTEPIVYIYIDKQGRVEEVFVGGS